LLFYHFYQPPCVPLRTPRLYHFIKIGELPQLFSNIGKLVFYLGLYIKMDFFPLIPLLLGLPVLLNVFGMIGSVLLQVVWMLIKPLFDPSVVFAPMVRIRSFPLSIVLSFEGFFTRRFLTDFVIFTPALSMRYSLRLRMKSHTINGLSKPSRKLRRTGWEQFPGREG
jgi:hypothetical protein